ncbi:MAG: hypothetical protein U1E83_11520, partial [Methylotetracoccus sp.]
GQGGKAVLHVDGKSFAEGRIERTIPIRIALDEGLDVGEDTGTPVVRTYDVPARFTGTIERVVIELKDLGPAPNQDARPGATDSQSGTRGGRPSRSPRS